jgi:hypothetical protein
MVVVMIVMVVVVVLMVVVMIVMVVVVVLMIVMMRMAIMFVVMVVQMPVQIVHVVIMSVMRFIQNDVEVAAIYARLFHPADLRFKPVSGNSLQHMQELVLVRTEVQERCNSHITAYACSAFQIQNFLVITHFSLFLPHARRLICVAMYPAP